MTFVHVPNPPNCVFHDSFMKSQLAKWDMSKAMCFNVFRYTKYYHRMAGTEFVLDLLNDEGAQDVLKVLLKNRELQPLKGQKITGVEVEVVPCTLTRMDIFDKIAEAGGGAQPLIVRGSGGDLMRRVDDVREGFQVTDNLREMLLCEESENAELYSEEEKSEFLWQLFAHISLGGPCCQYEDKIEPYLDGAKKLYKEMVMVHKNASTGRLEIASTVFRIKSIETESGTVSLFPLHSRNSFCYVSLDPLRRLAKVWYHAFIPFW